VGFFFGVFNNEKNYLVRYCLDNYLMILLKHYVYVSLPIFTGICL
jgi:hypothetical protein